MKNIIEIKGLKKHYNNFELGPIDLDIKGGVIVGLIGENGAGKTTLIKAMLNIINVDSGTINIFDKKMQKEELTIKDDIGVVLDNSFFPEILNAEDIDFIMKDLYKNWDSLLFKKYLEDLEIPYKKKIKELSKGMRKKLEIITALSHNPKLLILDEPTSGLDPIVRNEILDIFLKFIKDEEHTVLLSTHITSDLEHVADDIIFLNDGQIVLNKNRDDIMDEFAVMKCDKEYFNKIDKKDYISYKSNKYEYQILIKNKDLMKKKYKECIIDNITIEDLMLLIIKGEK